MRFLSGHEVSTVQSLGWRGILNCGRVHKEAEDKQAEHETEQAAPQLSFHGDSRKQRLSIQLDFGRNQPEPCSPLNSPSSLCNGAPYRRQEARIAFVRLPESRRGCEIKDLPITFRCERPTWWRAPSSCESLLEQS